MNEKLLKLNELIKAYEGLSFACKEHLGYTMRHQTDVAYAVLCNTHAEDPRFQTFISLLAEQGYITANEAQSFFI